MTEYQARVYLVLLDLGNATASEIPALAKVPRTRVYATLQQLHAKGLVQIVPERPIRYHPVPFAKYLKTLAADYSKKAFDLEMNADDLASEFRISALKVADHPGHFEALYGRRNVRARILEMYDRAEREVVATGSVHSAVRMARGLAAAFEELHNRGVRVSLAFHANEENRADIQSLSRFADVRHFEFMTPVCRHGVDGREFLMSHPIPDDDSTSRGDDIAIWTDDPAIAAALSNMTRRIWEIGKPLGPKLRVSRLAPRLTPKVER